MGIQSDLRRMILPTGTSLIGEAQTKRTNTGLQEKLDAAAAQLAASQQALTDEEQRRQQATKIQYLRHEERRQ